jgi:glycosyltransferase involved in cell wall biosynthesis
MRICLVNRYFDFRGTGVTRIATEVSKELKKRGHEVVQVATDGASLYAYAWQTAVKVAFKLPRDGIDAYHALATMEAMWLPKNKSIATYLDLFTTTNPDRAGAGMGYSRWKLEVGRRYFHVGSKIASRCRFLVCISDKTKQDVLKHVGADKQKLKVIRLGIRDDLKPENKRHNHLTIGTLGQLDKRKRIHLLIRAFHQSKLDAKLLIAGDGPDKPLLEILASDDNRIEFLGLVPDEELNEFYNSLDLFVFPSAIEGYGLPPVEAMACGKPVVILGDMIMPLEIRERCESVNDLRLFFDHIADIDEWNRFRYIATRPMESNLAFARQHKWANCVSEYIKLYEEIKEAN